MEEKQLIIIFKYINIKIFYKDADKRKYLILNKFILNNGILINLFIIMKEV